MPRVVVDTNVLVSALLHRGPTAQLLEAWQRGRITLVVSREVVQEYLRVLAYPKFQLTTEEVRFLIERHVIPYAHTVAVREVASVIAEDPSDDVFLACAVAGRARYLVSGDHHLVALKTYRGVTIVTPAALRSALRLS